MYRAPVNEAMELNSFMYRVYRVHVCRVLNIIMYRALVNEALAMERSPFMYRVTCVQGLNMCTVYNIIMYRALVNEAMELNSFMYRVSSVSKAERDLQVQ